MAENNGPGLAFIGLSGTTSLLFLTYHIYKFDGGRCLIPRRKDWFRCMLTWMLYLSNVCLVIFAVGWAYVKYQLAWVRLGPMGARPWPSALFPAKYDGFNAPLTVLLCVCYGLQASLNAEEGLYWAHLMRVVRRPKAAKPFLKSYYFASWIVISVIVMVVQLAVPWIGFDGNLQVQLAKELLVGGILELIVLCASTIIVFRFPKFLLDVAASGAGPDVRARLYYYQEANKVRTVFRFTFTVAVLILGADGITESAPINTNALASDMLITVMVSSLVLVMMISILLYLPRAAPSSLQNKVMVGQLPHHLQHTASGFALMTLLQEGGQLGGMDDDLGGMAHMGQRRGSNDAPFAGAEARPSSWSAEQEEKWGGQGEATAAGPPVPKILETFSSPFAVSNEAQPQRPVEIRIHVEREVHKD